MSDLLPEDEFDASYNTNERHSRYASLLMLIILAVIFWFSLASVSDHDTSSDNVIYQEDGIIEDIGKLNDSYFAIVSFEHDGELIHKSIDISYSEFIHYRENQPVKIKIEGNSYSIIQ